MSVFTRAEPSVRLPPHCGEPFGASGWVVLLGFGMGTAIDSYYNYRSSNENSDRDGNIRVYCYV
ncbi:hypothetical protein BDV38DRAFT_244372 [Aspergillus pseudotamarii]|uniref:Uncharacterized protein n=1 Tax=Aspergillus pseudotamarii TaxID=132259 RepID=A0A5N6SX73_ASPPS|nr:uncharacterized protein BDV38DRAFT_244372 [Aspergillus pseudotamarii]KAE8138340.1 hypothetical protein BDV38DRAFT_244372 [Aspergillus pseudotamarii]